MAYTARDASPDDVESITRIYNQGIRDRVGTFETRERTVADVRAWFDGAHPIVVVEDAGRVIGFASTSRYLPRECYDGIAEFSVYVDRPARGHGAGLVAMDALDQILVIALQRLVGADVEPARENRVDRVVERAARAVHVATPEGVLTHVIEVLRAVEDRLGPRVLRARRRRVRHGRTRLRRLGEDRRRKEEEA